MKINRKIKWNISSRRRWFHEADVFIVSVPKSGRTWLRVFLQAYMDVVSGRESSSAADKSLEAERQPRVAFTHDLWEHLTARHLWDRLRGKFLIPPGDHLEKKVVLMYRDPRDVVTSLYFQLSKRSNYYKGDISGLVRHSRYGIERIVQVMNTWMTEWGGRDNFLALSYEQCKRDEQQAFSTLLTYVGFKNVSRVLLDQSREAASFNKMRKLELSGKYPSGILRPGDPADPESYKVRRGKIGGYVDYLSDNDIAYANRAMEKLDVRFDRFL
ncbi:MAG: sulfotransferase domain-containing protein [Thermodesulfobacteriota bacterium]